MTDETFPDIADRERRIKVPCDDPVKVRRSKHARRKGSSAEREFRRMCEEAGLKATPVAASGAYAHGGHGDVRVGVALRMAELLGSRTDPKWELKAEVKSRKVLPKTLESWLGPCDILVLRGDGRHWRAYVPLDHYLELLAK